MISKDEIIKTHILARDAALCTHHHWASSTHPALLLLQLVHLSSCLLTLQEQYEGDTAEDENALEDQGTVHVEWWVGGRGSAQSAVGQDVHDTEEVASKAGGRDMGRMKECMYAMS